MSSDYGDKETRISIYGFILYLCGVPVLWKSKAGKSVMLSSTEVEYFSCSEAVKEVRFVTKLLESFGEKVQYPVKVL